MRVFKLNADQTARAKAVKQRVIECQKAETAAVEATRAAEDARILLADALRKEFGIREGGILDETCEYFVSRTG